MLRIFTTVKIQRLRLGLNPQTWVPEASMLTTRPPKPSNLGEGGTDIGTEPIAWGKVGLISVLYQYST